MEFNEKRLMILGAGRGQVSLIKTAKAMGMTTIVGTLPNNNLPGISLADEVCYMDISNPEEVLYKAKDCNLDGITTCCLDTGVNSVGMVSEHLGLYGLSEYSARLCSNKLNMKTILIDNGVNTAKFFKIENIDELNIALDNLNLPVIIKATDLQGSRGIYISRTREEAVKGFELSIEETKKDYCIVEEYIEGWEFGAQSFVYNGEILFVLPHGDNTFMSHTAVPVGHYVPLDCKEELISQAINQSKLAINALGLNNCAVNIDLIAKDGVIYVIELTGRVGANCLPELVSINYGINYYEMIAALAIGENPRQIFENKAIEQQAGLAKMIISEEKSGILKNISYEGVNDPDIFEITFFKEIGDEIHKFENSNDCIGQIIVKGIDMEACEQKVKEVLSNIKIILE